MYALGILTPQNINKFIIYVFKAEIKHKQNNCWLKKTQFNCDHSCTRKARKPSIETCCSATNKFTRSQPFTSTQSAVKHIAWYKQCGRCHCRSEMSVSITKAMANTSQQLATSATQ